MTYHNPDNGFAVLETAVKDQRDLVTVVGHLAFVIAGEFIQADGGWVVDRNHGQQFKADAIRTAHPGTPEEMQRYVGSGFVKSIGPHFATKPVEAFAGKVFEVIKNEPPRSTEIRGIGKPRQERITPSRREQRVVREIMVFLHSHGVGTARAVRIYKTYGDVVLIDEVSLMDLPLARRFRADLPNTDHCFSLELVLPVRQAVGDRRRHRRRNGGCRNEQVIVSAGATGARSTHAHWQSGRNFGAKPSS